VGMKWSHGGWDQLAKRLGVIFGKEWKKIFGDGDIKSLDLNIHYIFLQLCYTMSGVFFKKDHKDYAEMMRVIQFLASTISARLVHFFGRLWALVVGKMPSGCWLTSHGNSWIVALWFFIFCVMVIEKAPQHMKEKLEEDMIERIIHILVYGDDSATSTDRNSTAYYINMEQFEKWLKTYLKVEMRDVRADVPLLVHPSGGFHYGQGLVYLKHFGVRNQNDSKDQPYYLPYRDASDYMVRSVWGREAKDRDVYDFMLSLLGHSYGTYASNYYAYLWLQSAFMASVTTVPVNTWETTLATVFSRAHTNIDFVKKMRQTGILMADILKGFPTWDCLVSKNVYDPVYHAMFRGDTLDDEELVS